MFFKKIISVLALCACFISTINIPAFAATDIFFAQAQEQLISSDLGLLAEFSNRPLSEIIEFSNASSKILYYSTKHSLAYEKLGITGQSTKSLKNQMIQDFSYLENLSNNQYLTSILRNLYYTYKTTYLTGDNFTNGFETFYSYVNKSTEYVQATQFNEAFRNYFLLPIMNEYSFSQRSVNAVNLLVESRESQSGEILYLYKQLEVCAENEAPLAVKELYTALSEHYEKMSRGVYSTEIIDVIKYMAYGLDGRVVVAEEINKYMEFMNFTDLCENFRYISTLDVFVKINQEDALKVMSMLNNNALHYTENIKFKKMYYDLLCDNINYQNGDLKYEQLQQSFVAFNEYRTQMIEYYTNMYAEYGSSDVFTSSVIASEIELYNIYVLALCPKADSSTTYKYASQTDIDSNAYNPIQIKGNNPIILILVALTSATAITSMIILLLKLAKKHIEKISKSIY